MKAAAIAHESRRNYSKHGLTTLKNAAKETGGRLIDRRTTVGRALPDWKKELIEELGGEEVVSTQQLVIVRAGSQDETPAG